MCVIHSEYTLRFQTIPKSPYSAAWLPNTKRQHSALSPNDRLVEIVEGISKQTLATPRAIFETTSELNDSN